MDSDETLSLKHSRKAAASEVPDESLSNQSLSTEWNGEQMPVGGEGILAVPRMVHHNRTYRHCPLEKFHSRALNVVVLIFQSPSKRILKRHYYSPIARTNAAIST